MKVRFEKVRIDTGTYEAASAADIDGDGRLDIVCGAYWYKAPNWVKHFMCEVQPAGEYFDDFSDIPMDVNGNGRPDIITGGWWGETLRWREHPGGGDWAPWPTHDIAKIGSIETTKVWDVDGDGYLEIVPNTPGAPQTVFKLDRRPDGTPLGTFTQYTISEGASGHGLGFGDVNGDGRGDIILANGWLEQPAEGLGGKWTWHPEFNLGSASVPVLVHDVNGDGLADLIVGQAHDYGLHWWEQGRDAEGNRTWTRHEIDPTCSQYHDLMLVDIDNDGELELITGKRFRAHCGNDPGEFDPIGLYCFRPNGGDWIKEAIDFGPYPEASGAGIYFWVADMDGNGWLDIIAPGKDGLYLFRNLGP